MIEKRRVLRRSGLRAHPPQPVGYSRIVDMWRLSCSIHGSPEWSPATIHQEVLKICCKVGTVARSLVAMMAMMK